MACLRTEQDGEYTFCNRARRAIQGQAARILFTCMSILCINKQRAAAYYRQQPGGSVTSLNRHMTKEDYEKFSDFFNPDGTPKGDWVRSVAESTATQIVAAFDPSIAESNGGYLVDAKLAPEQAAPYATDKDSAKKLWELSETLVGQKFRP